jgi:hypothetical protein
MCLACSDMVVRILPIGDRDCIWLEVATTSIKLAGDPPHQYDARSAPGLDMLARNAKHLPDWHGLVVTSRPEFDVNTPSQALNPYPLDTQSDSNRSGEFGMNLEPHAIRPLHQLLAPRQ